VERKRNSEGPEGSRWHQAREEKEESLSQAGTGPAECYQHSD
jgi:hypothetical protein